jgi:hypothetical protein
MKYKILIGVTIAICILVGVSFTSVVGYRSVEYDEKASPLFNIRTNKALNKNTNTLDSNYVGKNNEIFYKFPDTRQDKDKKKIVSIIEIISLMNDNDFEKLCKKITYKMINHMGFLGTYRQELINVIKELRNNPELCNIYLNEKTDNDFTLNVGKFISESPLSGELFFLLILIGLLVTLLDLIFFHICVRPYETVMMCTIYCTINT